MSGFRIEGSILRDVIKVDWKRGWDERISSSEYIKPSGKSITESIWSNLRYYIRELMREPGCLGAFLARNIDK